MCSGGNSGHVADSDIDCNGDCFGEAILDDCGVCSGGNSDHIANSDDIGCGCFEASPLSYCLDLDGDSLGDIGTETSYCLAEVPSDVWINDCTDTDDTCGAFSDEGEPNFYDCNGDCGGESIIDYCGNCTLGNTGLNEGYANLGCGCDLDPPFTYCEDTDGDGLGNPGSDEIYCSEVSFGNEYELLPDGNWSLIDECIDQYPDCDVNYYDCNNDCGGLALVDDCDVCSGGNTDHEFNSDQDCAGVCFGDSVLDECGICDGDGLSSDFYFDIGWTQCLPGDPECLDIPLEDQFIPNNFEYSATITSLQILIDGVEQTGGQIAAFVNDEIRALDSNGATYFPPSDINLYELSIWSNELSGDIVNFKYFDEEHHVLIDLNETYTFESNDVVGNGFEPFILTGNLLTCDCNGNYFDDCGSCGGEGTDLDNDNICDDIDDCIGEYDECGVCEGFGFDDNFYFDIGWTQCLPGDPECLDIPLEDQFIPNNFEYSATITSLQILIDGVEQTGGQIAAFVNDEIRALDSNGATYFPPSDINLYELSIWSNELSGDIVNFKYFDEEHHVLIDLNETYTFESNDVVGNGFEPFILTGNLLTCDCNGNYFDDCGSCGGFDYFDENGLLPDGSCDCYGQIFDECGVCGGDNTTCLDCAGIPNGDAVIDDCGICSDGSSGHEFNSDQDCAGVCFGEAFLDDCEVCSGGTTGHEENSDQDCAGVCFGTAFIDNCGVCSGGNTDHKPDSDIDDCGVCFGENVDQDCAGVCFGEAFLDDCEVCSGGTTGHKENSDQDCAGVCFGEAFLDDCEVCSGGTTGHKENSDQDCAGVCFGEAFLDDCEVCSGGTTGHKENSDQDCAGICFGEAFLDSCDICSGGTTDHKPDSDIDDCGVCFGENVDQDCAGVCFGEAFLDSCDVCSGGTTDHKPDSDIDDCGVCFGENADQDCNGDCFGYAVIDDCGICSDGNSGHEFNSDQDCAGVCFGEAFLDDCEVCSGGTTGHEENSDQDCNGDCFGYAVIDDCGICSDGNSGHEFNSDQDCEGVCFGEAFLDDCEVCSGGTTGHEENSDQDCAGVCFGEAYIDECDVCDDVVENDNLTCTGCTDGDAFNFDENATITCELDQVLNYCCEYTPQEFNLITPEDESLILFDAENELETFIDFSWSKVLIKI